MGVIGRAYFDEANALHLPLILARKPHSHLPKPMLWTAPLHLDYSGRKPQVERFTVMLNLGGMAGNSVL